MSRDPKTGRYVLGSDRWLGRVLRERAGERSGPVPTGQAPAEASEAVDAAAEAVSHPGGMGGGIQGVEIPQGESLGDIIRRKVWGD
jgi:hypothetical protein